MKVSINVTERLSASLMQIAVFLIGLENPTALCSVPESLPFPVLTPTCLVGHGNHTENCRALTGIENLVDPLRF